MEEEQFKDRELKFRVWNPDEEQMMHFTLNNIWFPDRYLIQDKYDVQQYTGLKDWTGKEIYEGDILARLNTEYFYEVRYDVEGTCYLVTNKDGQGNLGYYRKLIEVIGNIFETPDLLNKHSLRIRQ